jgi:hypothetical protein
MTPKLFETIKPLLQREFDPNETLKVLTYGENRMKYWCWGVSKKVNIENKGLLLKVSARRFKSYVLIALAWDDTYNVHLISSQGNVLKSFESVYFDILCETIDDEIERIPEYKD